ncbi:Hypothetical predicted protein [Paramuricea clavata]|uniref:Uncharacterized protein n=1 Tax=Paramuricea clavata TaxID=317549 RepID=A0A7D9HM91_PARCT|nr:Hypothetical predicted protein [Paramuricea clavata]
MKYALFEFVNEKACEIGETQWITREDPETFQNINWDVEKEIIVAWPTEFSKVSKKIVKGSIDPLKVSTTTCVARVLKFSDDYESIRQHMTRYIETGSIATPSHGRGQRTSQKTSRYDDSNEESEQERSPKRQKRQQHSRNDSTSDAAIQALKAKYNFHNNKVLCASQSQSAETEDNNTTNDDQIKELKKENHDLQQEIKKTKKLHICMALLTTSKVLFFFLILLPMILPNFAFFLLNEAMFCKLTISIFLKLALSAIPSLPGIVTDLRKQVEKLKDGNSSSISSSSGSLHNSPLSAGTLSRSPSLKESANSDDESDVW